MNKAFKKYTGIKYKNTGIGKRHKAKSSFKMILGAKFVSCGYLNEYDGGGAYWKLTGFKG